jgi:hypothetical protein
MSRKALLMLVFVLLVGLSVPVHAEEAPAVAPTPAPAGCGLSFELPPATTQAGVCPATVSATNPVPELLFGGRTCRCSCGFPCKKDADCGPGGICSGGITCC